MYHFGCHSHSSYRFQCSRSVQTFHLPTWDSPKTLISVKVFLGELIKTPQDNSTCSGKTTSTRGCKVMYIQPVSTSVSQERNKQTSTLAIWNGRMGGARCMNIMFETPQPFSFSVFLVLLVTSSCGDKSLTSNTYMYRRIDIDYSSVSDMS